MSWPARDRCVCDAVARRFRALLAIRQPTELPRRRRSRMCRRPHFPRSGRAHIAGNSRLRAVVRRTGRHGSARYRPMAGCLVAGQTRTHAQRSTTHTRTVARAHDKAVGATIHSHRRPQTGPSAGTCARTNEHGSPIPRPVTPAVSRGETSAACPLPNAGSHVRTEVSRPGARGAARGHAPCQVGVHVVRPGRGRRRGSSRCGRRCGRNARHRNEAHRTQLRRRPCLVDVQRCDGGRQLRASQRRQKA